MDGFSFWLLYLFQHFLVLLRHIHAEIGKQLMGNFENFTIDKSWKVDKFFLKSPELNELNHCCPILNGNIVLEWFEEKKPVESWRVNGVEANSIEQKVAVEVESWEWFKIWEIVSCEILVKTINIFVRYLYQQFEDSRWSRELRIVQNWESWENLRTTWKYLSMK